MRLYKTLVFFSISFYLFLCIPTIAYANKAKSRFTYYSPYGKADNRQLRAFEEHLTPFFQIKARGDKALGSLKSVNSPSQADLFFIAKNWKLFSPAFQSLYQSSSPIPSFMTSYQSPGGHFEIYYATAGMDTVKRPDTVAATDTYGFNSSNWRQRTDAPNGVPDYIDEVAWAFDSAWSMEIDRFGFKHPIPYTSSSHPSERYKVIILDMDFHYGKDQGRYYGLTTPLSKSSGTSIGMPSYIELRNQWNGWNDPDYEHHPEDGARVTAVHEFFHTIQFAMTRDDNEIDSNYLDNFPLTWLEASAVLMEEMGFDYINDYLQYASDYFDNPTKDVFRDYDDYTISLLLMYATQHFSTPGDIGLTKSMFFNNYKAIVPFNGNLLLSAKESGGVWADLLGKFHTESFFTGSRSTARPFIADASLLPEWSYDGDEIDNNNSIRKRIPPYAMETFSFKPKQGMGNSIRITFIGDSIPASEADTDPLWSVHGILRKSDERNDSVFSLTVPHSGVSGLLVTDWSSFDEALMIVTNAHSDDAHDASMVFETCPLSMRAGDSTTYHGVISEPLSAISSVSVSVKALGDLSCSLSIESAKASPAQIQKAVDQKLKSVPVLYGINFPASWSSVATMTLTIREDTVSFTSLKDNYGISSSALAIFLWNPQTGSWDKTGVAEAEGNAYSWRIIMHSPGMYGLFAQISGDSAGAIAAYPNPVRRNSEMRFRSKGKALMQLFVYSISGDLIYRWETASPVDTIKWSIKSNNGKPIVPGMYYALIGYKDPSTKGLIRKRQKVLIVP